MPELLAGNDHRLSEKVRCPVHGFIRYSKNERKVIDHWAFQRLRHIRQLAMTYLVYPGAMHSRFEHSLGVMELTTRAFDTICIENSERIAEELKRIPEFAENTIAKARQTIRLMALLHDVGHPAFSHAAENTIPGGDHELLSVYVIDKVLGTQLDELFFQGTRDLVKRMMEKSQELTFLRQFVASQMDMDRTDYLQRDSLHCGVSYGIFDSQRLIECLTVVENPDSGRLQLAIKRGGEHTFEALILARYQMNTQVYFHRIRRIYDHYLMEYMKLWGIEHHKSYADVLEHDDSTVITDVRKDAKAENDRSPWARRLVNRQHHHCILESGDFADQQRLKLIGRVQQKLASEYKGVDFYLDDAAHDIHKLSVPGDQQESKVEDLYVIEKGGQRKLLAAESGIINKIPKRVRTVRIFADPLESVNMDDLMSRARQLEKEEL